MSTFQNINTMFCFHISHIISHMTAYVKDTIEKKVDILFVEHCINDQLRFLSLSSFVYAWVIDQELKENVITFLIPLIP